MPKQNGIFDLPSLIMKPYNHTDEKELLLRLRDGDHTAFNLLMEQYKRPLAKNMLRILKSREDTEEALQDLFMRVWANRDKIEPDKPIKSYLFTIAENLVYDLFRKAVREKRLAMSYQTMQTELYSHIEENIFEEENRALLYQVISQIPEQRRKVFVMCKLEGKSYEEVGQILSISPATVNAHITKAYAFLKEYSRNPKGATLIFAGYLLTGLQ